jgi:hypothetical protein
MTSSARTRIAGAIVIPMALAVLRFRTSSNLIGRSAAFAPFAMSCKQPLYSITSLASASSSHEIARNDPEPNGSAWVISASRIQLGSGRAVGCRTPRLRLSVEIVAQVGVAVGGIVPQALVKLKGLIELTNPLARVADGRRVVWSGSRRLPQQGRTWEPTRRGRRWNETGATSRDLDVAFRRLAFRLFARIAPALTGSFRPLQPLHDDRRSLIHHDVRYRRAIEGLLLGRRRSLFSPESAKNEDQHNGQSFRGR